MPLKTRTRQGGEDEETGDQVELKVETLGGRQREKFSVKKGTRLGDLLREKKYDTKKFGTMRLNNRDLARDETGELSEDPEITENSVLTIVEQRFVHGQ